MSRKYAEELRVLGHTDLAEVVEAVVNSRNARPFVPHMKGGGARLAQAKALRNMTVTCISRWLDSSGSKVTKDYTYKKGDEVTVRLFDDKIWVICDEDADAGVLVLTKEKFEKDWELV